MGKNVLPKSMFLLAILRYVMTKVLGLRDTLTFCICVFQSAGLPKSLVNVLSICKNVTYSMFSIFLMLLLSSHRVFSPMYSSKPSMVWKPLWCKYRTVLSLGVIYKLFCRQCSWKEDRKNQSISWFSLVVHSGMELLLTG